MFFLYLHFQKHSENKPLACLLLKVNINKIQLIKVGLITLFDDWVILWYFQFNMKEALK